MANRRTNLKAVKSTRSINRQQKLAGTRAGVVEDWRSIGVKPKGKAQRTATVRDGR
jgi:hypothetical protein